MMYSAMAEELLKISTVKVGAWTDYATKQEHADINETAKQYGWHSPRTVGKIDSLIQRHADNAKKSEPSRLGIGARVIGATALGAGIGTAAGYGAGALTNAIYRHYTGHPLPQRYVVPATTLLGGLAGMGIVHLREKNLEDIRNAIKGK